VEAEPDRRTRATDRRFASHADADAADIAYWRMIPPEERIRQVWTLTLAQWRLAGPPDDAPRLCRSVERVHRR
jgi:hypothetical protein